MQRLTFLRVASVDSFVDTKFKACERCSLNIRLVYPAWPWPSQSVRANDINSEACAIRRIGLLVVKYEPSVVVF